MNIVHNLERGFNIANPTSNIQKYIIDNKRSQNEYVAQPRKRVNSTNSDCESLKNNCLEQTGRLHKLK